MAKPDLPLIPPVLKNAGRVRSPMRKSAEQVSYIALTILHSDNANNAAHERSTFMLSEGAGTLREFRLRPEASTLPRNSELHTGSLPAIIPMLSVSFEFILRRNRNAKPSFDMITQTHWLARTLCGPAFGLCLTYARPPREAVTYP